MSSKKVHYDACPIGHADLSSTTRYAHVATNLIASKPCPFDRLSCQLIPPE